jgi:gamma-glutamylaminecyclotransferase
MSPRIFVYGTLRRGGSNHHLMVEGGAELAEYARTRPEFVLLDLGPHPAMVAGGSTSVTGEVYVVSDALRERLDRLEDHPRWYTRIMITLDGDCQEAEAYVMPSRPPDAKPIESGDWLTHLALRR